MALNLARKLRFHRGFLQSRYHGTQHFRHFGNTSQASRTFNDGSVRYAKFLALKKRTVDEVLGEGIEKPKRLSVPTLAEL